ncbi:hypothetical protein OQA88_10661 [Cercophora sp. LCS_1]
MALNSLSTSLVAATNENSLALASMKMDISLIKVEVPAEYKALDSALTSKRRDTAEQGPAHKTARRLGILFQDVLPSTPELLRAYGRRSSEITEKMSVNTDSSASNGIFEEFLGVDITSIWAAATSGASSIAAHLLACLLARSWSASEATSIWVEIVTEKKHISRRDLAEWDAGARAWLQIADEAQTRRQKQLMLIIKNIHLPVNTQGSTYDRVMGAWTTALNAMERLILGQPQRVANGAALVGIASWHLYPDLLVLGESMTSVKFADELISEMGQLTVGLENTDPNHRDGIFWSLPLSQLRFYGDPVWAISHTNDALRLTIAELELVVFGSAISSWGGHYLDPLKVARFFQILRDKVERQEAQSARPPHLLWLQPLWSAATTLLSATTGDELKNALATVALGRRNGKNFLAEKSFHPPPFFGLGKDFVSSLFMGPGSDLDLWAAHRLRYLASKLRLLPGQAIIRKRLGQTASFEYATAVPHKACLLSRIRPKHGRWLPQLPSSWGTHSAFFQQLCHEVYEDVQQQESRQLCPGCSRYAGQELDFAVDPTSHLRMRCPNIPVKEFITRFDTDLFRTVVTPSLGSAFDVGVSTLMAEPSQNASFFIQRDNKYGELCSCYDSEISIQTFAAIAGHPDGVALFVRFDRNFRQLRGHLRKTVSELSTSDQDGSKDDDGVPNSRVEKFHDETVHEFLTRISVDGVVLQSTLDRGEESLNVEPYLQSLTAFSLVRDVYKCLGGATASIRIIDRPLYSLRWVPQVSRDFLGAYSLDRPRRFACIAAFESGTFDLDPSGLAEVIALSTRNSLFASAVLLNDPFDDAESHIVRHVVGNVGKTGMVMMVAPLAPKVRAMDLNNWRRISHCRFDKKREDCFQATTLHLSFTEFEMPMDIGQRGSIDRDIHIRVVETVVSVYDKGDWVADLDILLLYEPILRGNDYVKRLEQTGETQCRAARCEHRTCQPLTSIDNWEELLNLPEDMGMGHIGVVRAHDNRLARLATACVAAQKGFRTVILPTQKVCWDCCSSLQWHWDFSAKNQAMDNRTNNRCEPSRRNGVLDYLQQLDEPRFEAWDFEARFEREAFDDDDDSYSIGSESTGSIVSVQASDKFNAPPHVFIC